MCKKVLIVDDEADIRAFLKILLEDNGYRVDMASDGNEGYELFNSFSPDLALIDVIMPEKGGINLFNQIRKDEKFAHIPVIILSSVVKQKGQFLQYVNGIRPPEAFCDKPFDERKLLKIIKELL